jgi:type I restriction enzyme S subunit
MRSGQPGINGNEYARLLIPLPEIDEQIAITGALSDTDALIEEVEKLIKKKKSLKQGVMYDLLNGKRRLQGFDGEWETKTLDDLFLFSGGLSASRSQLSDDGLCYLHYGDIHNSKRAYIDVKREFPSIPKLKISLKVVPKKSLLEDGDIVFVDASEDDKGASRHIVVRNPERIPFISGLHTIVAKGKEHSVENSYKEYCFQCEAVKRQFKYYAVGTKVTGISKTNIPKIVLKLPSKPEQSAIASILSDVDAEIDLLERNLAKYRLVRLGMIQNLLTGKIRLYETPS